jgi:hypothetical protein
MSDNGASFSLAGIDGELTDITADTVMPRTTVFGSDEGHRTFALPPTVSWSVPLGADAADVIKGWMEPPEAGLIFDFPRYGRLWPVWWLCRKIGKWAGRQRLYERGMKRMSCRYYGLDFELVGEDFEVVRRVTATIRKGSIRVENGPFDDGSDE